MRGCPVQAAQVRKSNVGGLGLAGYHPNTHHAYTVHSGTHVQQVLLLHLALQRFARIPAASNDRQDQLH